MSYHGGGHGRDPRGYDNRRYFEQGRGGGGRGQYDRGRQPYPSSHHHGGRGRDRSRSSGPGPFQGRRLVDQDYQVQTNYFRITMKEQQRSCLEYRATIFVGRRIKKGPDEELLETPRIVFREKRGQDGTYEPGTRIEVSMDMGATQKTEDIMLALHRSLAKENPPRFIATDGGRTVFASKPLFDPNEVSFEQLSSKKDSLGRVSGIYGPSDEAAASGQEEAMQVDESESPLPSQLFPVTVRKDCRYDDDFKDSMPEQHYLISLEFIGDLHYKRSGLSVWPLHDEDVEKFNQFLNILGRTSMLTNGCRSFMSKSRSLYFPSETQERLAQDTLGFSIPEGARDAELLGLNQSSRASTGKQFFYARNTVMTKFHLSKNHVRNSPEYRKIPVLDAENGTIAGVRFVRNPRDSRALHQPVPLEYRNEIETALDKLQFHVMFRGNPSEEQRAEFHRKFGKDGSGKARSPEEIEKLFMRVQDHVRANVWMRQSDTTEKPLIIWSADDPEEHSFEFKGTNVTVYTYMERRHGIRLRYPKMPIVQTMFGYYPVEFMFQALGIAKGANDDQHKMTVLKYHDENAGERKILHIKRVVEVLDSRLEREFGFEINTEPVTQMAKLLAEPQLEFGGKFPQDVRNGSWNLVQRGQAIQFERPADFTSFCVVDFVGDQKLVTGVLNRSAQHGITNVQYQKEYSEVTQAVTVTVTLTESARMVQQVHDGVRDAIARAKDFFLRDSTEYFRRRHIMFETIISHPNEGTTKCLLYPNESESGLNILYPFDVMAVTHRVAFPGGSHDARMHVVCRTQSGERLSVDPFNFRWNSVLQSSDSFHWEARRDGGGNWERVSFQEYEWRLIQANGAISNTAVDMASVEFSITFDDTWKIDCPSIVFVILPKKENEIYALVKLATNFYQGVQSQCLVWKTYEEQKRKRNPPDQYFSNIALKLNTKLSNSMNKAQAWRIGEYRQQRGMPWVTEHTMIVGLAMSRGGGRESKTVVAGTVALVDEKGSCMENGHSVKIQSSPDTMETSMMQDIIKKLTLQLCDHTRTFPEKVLVFRDGSSEGHFPALKSEEIAGINRGLLDAWNDWHEPLGSAPDFLPPKVTYVVCVNQHNVQIVPYKGNGVGRGAQNVPSGTCVDDVILAFSDASINSNEASNKSEEVSNKSDFLLTSQGGLKGTSKPVYFRVLQNDNEDLTRPVLESLVYSLSFCYGTATKATRRLSVTQYSKRLAEQFLAYLPYIDENNTRKEGIPGMPALEYSGEGEEGRVVVRSYEGEEDTDLLPGFSVRKGEGWHAPLRPHLAS